MILSNLNLCWMLFVSVVIGFLIGFMIGYYLDPGDPRE